MVVFPGQVGGQCIAEGQIQPGQKGAAPVRRPALVFIGRQGFLQAAGGQKLLEPLGVGGNPVFDALAGPFDLSRGGKNAGGRRETAGHHGKRIIIQAGQNFRESAGGDGIWVHDEFSPTGNLIQDGPAGLLVWYFSTTAEVRPRSVSKRGRWP